MTQIPGSEGGTQPLRPDQVLQKAAQPQRQAASPETEPATKRLAEQSHTLELSKSRMPASELAALKVHFSEQKSAKATAQTFAPAELGSDWRWAEAHPVYGLPTPPRRFDFPPRWPKEMDGRLVYGDPSKKRPDDLLPKDKEPVAPPPLDDWKPKRPRDGWPSLRDLFRWPDDMGLRNVYGLPEMMRKLEF